MATILTALTKAEKTLTQSQSPNSRTDVEWILADVLHCTRSDLHLNPHQKLTTEQIQIFDALINQRAQRIPLQHILGQTEFYGLPFYAAPAALIPRPETEILIETILNRTPAHPVILDIGTGSGIIAITLATQLPSAQIIATDISAQALQLARQNAQLNKVSDQITYLRANLLPPLNKSFDIITSNPPYIPANDIDLLEPEVRIHDPILALDGGLDGLDFYRKIIPSSTPLLNTNGWLALEIGHNQATDVSHMLSQQPDLAHIGIQTDLSGHPRVAFAQKV